MKYLYVITVDGLKLKTDAAKYLASVDPMLEKIIETTSLPGMASTNNVFNDLMSCVLEQQIHYRSTKKTYARMLEASGLSELTLDNFLVFEEKGISGAKLSTQKYETVLQIVAFFEYNQVEWQQLSDEAVRKTLGQIKGIGNWTKDMILLYTLNPPDIFPADDYHLKKIMVSLYGLNPDNQLKLQMQTIANSWQPHSSAAVRYLLAWKAEGNRTAGKTKS